MPRSAPIQSPLQRSPAIKARTRTNQLTSPTASSFKTPRTHIADVSKSSGVTPRVGLESKRKEARKSTARPAVPPPNCVPENPSVPRQLWLMKTDPDYMVCPPLANAPMVSVMLQSVLSHRNVRRIRWINWSEIPKQLGLVFEATRRVLISGMRFIAVAVDTGTRRPAIF